MPKLSYYYEMSRRVHPIHTLPKIGNYIKYRYLKRKPTTSIQRYTPQIGSLLVTRRCNLNCGYCSVARILHKDGENWRESEINLEKVKRIFANPLFANCLLVDLLGGEPLLVEDLDRIVAYLSERGHIINISTNGLLLAERITGLKRAGISRVNISLYDANQLVIERDIVKINHVFSVHISIVLLRTMVEDKQDELLKTARFLRDAGCRSLCFWAYRPVGVNPQLKETISDTHLVYVEFRRRMDDALPGFCAWPAPIQTGVVKKLCSQLWQRISCDASGNMAICCGTDMLLKGPNSNLFDTEPDVLFNHSMLVGMREQLINPKCEPPDICRACNLLGDSGW